jgi:hypothetical protein
MKYLFIALFLSGCMSNPSSPSNNNSSDYNGHNLAGRAWIQNGMAGIPITYTQHDSAVRGMGYPDQQNSGLFYSDSIYEDGIIHGDSIGLYVYSYKGGSMQSQYTVQVKIESGDSVMRGKSFYSQRQK